mgnify:FL=1
MNIKRIKNKHNEIGIEGIRDYLINNTIRVTIYDSYIANKLQGKHVTIWKNSKDYESLTYDILDDIDIIKDILKKRGL